MQELNLAPLSRFAVLRSKRYVYSKLAIPKIRHMLSNCLQTLVPQEIHRYVCLIRMMSGYA